MPPPNSITFAGAAHMDRIGRGHGPLVPARSNPGNFQEYPGGTALNTASIFAALGGHARLLTVLGNDGVADSIENHLQHRQVELVAQRPHGASTGNYTAILNPDGELNVALADMEIYEHFDATMLETSLRKYDWLCLDANLPEKQLQTLCEMHQGPIAALTASTAKAPRLLAVAAKIDLLFTNRSEVAALTGSDDEAVHHDPIVELGIAKVVVSDGPEQVLLLENGNWSKLPVSAPKTVLDTTGAGDALAGATLFALGAGAELGAAVETGIAAAQAILQVRGPWRDDLREGMKFSKKQVL